MSNHQFPRRGSSPHISLNALHNVGGAASMQSWRKVRDWRGSAARFRLDVVDRLVLSGLVALVDDQFAVTASGRKYLGIKQQLIDGAAAPVVGPCYEAPSRPLNIALHRPARPGRIGSMDFASIPSRMADQSIAYKGPGSLSGLVKQ
jgi:hypothetical protein